MSPPIHPADLPIDDLLKQCDIKTTRGSGPGGQHRNKVESAIVITHSSSGVIGQASEQRSQHENRKRAIKRLRINLALGVRLDRGGGNDEPSELWKSRLHNSRIAVNRDHDDFPSLLAEAMDRIHSEQFDLKATASQLGCSQSQLIKLLKLEPQGWAWLNRSREKLGLKKLR